MKKFFFIKLIFILLFISTKYSCADFIRSTTFNDRSLCDLNKGVWREFGNGCVDNCSAKFDNYMICTNAITYGCDCGKGKCWHENKCIKLLEYEKIHSIKKEQDEQNFQKQKNARQEELKAFQQERLRKLIADKSPQLNNITNNIKAIQNSDPDKQQKLSNINNYDKFYDQENANDEISNNQNKDSNLNDQQNYNQDNNKNSFLGSILNYQTPENKNQEFEIPPMFLLKEKIKEENLNKNGQEVQTLPEVSIDEFSSKK